MDMNLDLLNIPEYLLDSLEDLSLEVAEVSDLVLSIAVSADDILQVPSPAATGKTH